MIGLSVKSEDSAFIALPEKRHEGNLFTLIK